MDMKMDFLNGGLEKDVYMKHPESFSSSDSERVVYIIKMSIYGLKQAFVHGTSSSMGSFLHLDLLKIP